MKIVCPVCMHHCAIEERKTGRCRARGNSNGKIVCSNYGKITSYALDPIEKKPLRHFYPGSSVLSVGSYGCNLSCDFCQNYRISMVSDSEAEYDVLMPEKLVEEAVKCRKRSEHTAHDCIGIAYTYNEPLIGYEYVRDCAKLAGSRGLKNILVTNGCAELEILEEILPFIDAFNIDLKGFTEEFYNKVGGNLTLVKKFIERAAQNSHVEITTLVIPKENDSREEIIEIAKWLSSIDKEIPLHISRFFPQWKMTDINPTQVEVVYRLAGETKQFLTNVYTGNC